MPCSACGGPLTEVYSSTSDVSVTSVAALVPGRTVVSACARCGHAETAPILDATTYYDTEYKIGASSAEEDDLYAIVDGRHVLRSEHMARVFLEKTARFHPEKVLDYGCGKSLLARRAMSLDPRLDFFLVDVSHDYEQFWRTFRPSDKCAVLDTPPAWDASFDCVTSLFALEHVPSPRESLTRIRRLLREGGILYAVVPDMYSANRMDLLVIDHLHHFTTTSMHCCLAASGFELVDLDRHSHQQASIVLARAVTDAAPPVTPDPQEVAAGIRYVHELADYWRSVEQRLREFEDRALASGVTRLFIYGAGAVGAYLHSRVRDKRPIAAFIDANVHKQRRTCGGLPVLAPEATRLQASDGLLVGLNAGLGESVIRANRNFDLAAAHTFFV
jgi:SAM-dependent methyltransferase